MNELASSEDLKRLEEQHDEILLQLDSLDSLLEQTLTSLGKAVEPTQKAA